MILHGHFVSPLGVFKMEGKLFQTTLYVMPLVGGYLPVPRATIVKYHIPSILDATPEVISK